MTPDKEHAPALMQQAADEAEAIYELWVYNYLVVRDEALGYSAANEEDAYDEWKESAREIVRGIDYARNRRSPTIATLTAQLAAAEAKVAVAVNPPPAGYESWQAWLGNPPPPTPALRELMRKFRENQNSAPAAPTYEQGVAAGLEMAAKVAIEALEPFASIGDAILAEAPENADAYMVFTDCEGGKHGVMLESFRQARSAIRALADQHKPSPAEEPMP